jgi:serine/threonine protein kinase
VPEEGGEEG